MVYTEKAKHGFEISSANVNLYDIIVAVGGDGSVNEIGKALINTGTTLAIIPAGSGNGLARDLSIPLRLKHAISLINNGNTKTIDTVQINDDYFLGTAGVGFDADISWKFDEAPNRGFWTYIKVALKGFLNYQSMDYTISFDGQEKTISKGFLVTFANSKQYGNNIIICPNAQIDDGYVRLVVVKKFPLIYLPVFGYYLFRKKIHQFNYTEVIKAKEYLMTIPNQKIHLDGEPVIMDHQLKVKVLPKSLKIIIP